MPAAAKSPPSANPTRHSPSPRATSRKFCRCEESPTKQSPPRIICCTTDSRPLCGRTCRTPCHPGQVMRPRPADESRRAGDQLVITSVTFVIIRGLDSRFRGNDDFGVAAIRDELRCFLSWVNPARPRRTRIRHLLPYPPLWSHPSKGTRTNFPTLKNVEASSSPFGRGCHEVTGEGICVLHAVAPQLCRHHNLTIPR